MTAPMPRSSSQRMTPPAASRPKALPPARTIACTLSIALTGSSSSVSRVPGDGAAHVDAGDGAFARDDDRAAGRPARVSEVADLEAGDRGQAKRHPQANTPAVVCIRRDTSPSWYSVSPKVSSITVSRLK